MSKYMLRQFRKGPHFTLTRYHILWETKEEIQVPIGVDTNTNSGCGVNSKWRRVGIGRPDNEYNGGPKQRVRLMVVAEIDNS